MTDLIHRLKEQAQWYSDGHGPLHQEAAAEIERLQTALRRIRSLAEKNVPKYAQQIAGEALGYQQSTTPKEG